MNRLAIIAIALAPLAGCLTDGDGPIPLTPEELAEKRADPRVVNAGRILDNADTLLIPAAYFNVIVSADDVEQETSMVFRGSCTGLNCYLTGTTPDETLELSLEELNFIDSEDDDGDEHIIRFELGERDGFNTVLVEGASHLTDDWEGVEAGATALSYGIWADYGFAAVVIAGGTISIEDEGETIQADIRGGLAFVAGEPAGSNPTGIGSATWRGIAEAVETRTFQSRYGTAHITIPELAEPSVDVEIDIRGYSIGSAAWHGIPLDDGRYEAGISGRDRLVGDFYGPEHEETYGVFDTGAYVGAFGAR